MGENTKIVHVAIVDGGPEHIKAMSARLNELKKKLDFDVEFIVSNDNLQFRDAKYLLEELYNIVKNKKK